MGLMPHEVAVVYEDERRIIWHSTNFCPTLEACLRLGLDTRVVCRAATERSVEALIRRSMTACALGETTMQASGRIRVL